MSRADRIEYLSQFNLMHSLSEEDLIEMDKLTSITPYARRAFIQTPDSFAEKLYFIKKGKVRLFRLNAEGKQFTLDILGEGNVFGDMNGISLGTRGLFIEALEPCDICMMDRDRFENFLAQHPRFMLNMIRAMSDRLSHMSGLAQSLAIGNLHARVIHALLKLADRFGAPGDKDGYLKLDLPLTHQELAHLVGATREAVTLALQELADGGAVKTGFRTISVRVDQLRALLEM